jgi:hypothetical protein
VWRRFLIDLELARNYPAAFIQFPLGVRRCDPILDQLLPSLLHIKAVAVLDAGLKVALSAKRLTVPRPYGGGLKGCINFLHDQSIIDDVSPLQAIRETRNDVAHEFEGSVTWTELEAAVAAIQQALEQLALIPARPVLEFFAERSAMEASPNETAIGQCRYKFGLKDTDGQEIATVTWTETLLRDDVS